MSTIEIKKASITDVGTEAVVNAANEGLWAGSGVCGAIFDAAGYGNLKAACDAIGHCDTGSAVITPGFNLSKYIIHAVGPIYSDGRHDEARLLYSAYKKALELAKANDCHSIGFPLISTGVYHYPVREAWQVAVRACFDFAQENSDYFIEIVFAILKDEIFECGAETIKNILPQTEESGVSIARKSDWNTEEMPEQHDTFTLNRSFSKAETDTLRKGHVPKVQEDKWFWYMEGDTLYLHRSWTGFCIFIIEFSPDGAHRVTVNRKSDQYVSHGIEEDSIRLNKLLNYMIVEPYDYYTEWLAETADNLLH